MVANPQTLFSTHHAHAFWSDDLADLATIYEPDINVCLVKRQISPVIDRFVHSLLASPLDVAFVENIEPPLFDFLRLISKAEHLPGYGEFCQDVALLTAAFSDLFGLKRVGLRLRTLDHAMCPRFHVDSVTCRLVCTYGGAGTEWLEDAYIDRKKLGRASAGLKDEHSGLILDADAVYQMQAYAVGLLKGSAWEGNEQQGAVHRSPRISPTLPRRLLLTMDFG